MRTVGIIAEYNPFHTGHAYHIREAKERSGADYVVVVMSPDFVQRGEPAVFDKYTRARMALQNGADLVLELPVCYAAGSAEYFAQGGVALLDSLGVIDVLCFGAETADSALFSRVADVLAREPEPFAQKLRSFLKEGDVWPSARARALSWYLAQDGGADADSAVRPARAASGSRAALTEFLSSPNNILGIEYCKALQRSGSAITLLPVLRVGSRYDSSALDGVYCSASALRAGIAEKFDTEYLLRYIPENCHALFPEACRNRVTSEELLPFLVQKLLSCDSYSAYLDISPDLSDRIRSLRLDCIGRTYEEITALLRTKQFTEGRIRRSLLHLILGIRAEDVRTYREQGTVFYARVLGLRRDAAPLLHRIRRSARLPLLVKPAHARALPAGSAGTMWETDLFASHLYRSIPAMRTHAGFRSEYECGPVIL